MSGRTPQFHIELDLISGDKVQIGENHQWAGKIGTLVSYKPRRGWLVKLSNGYECYCRLDELKKINAK